MAFERKLDDVVRIARRAVTLRCPRCGRTPLFRTAFAMHEVCAVCGLRFERAQGYWVGAIYINYAVTTVIAIAGYFTLWRYDVLSTAAQLALWIPFVIVFPLVQLAVAAIADARLRRRIKNHMK